MPKLADQKQRTADITSESRSFQDLLLPADIVRGLSKLGFHRPTPVQHEALPVVRLGVNAMVQVGSARALAGVIAMRALA